MVQSRRRLSRREGREMRRTGACVILLCTVPFSSSIVSASSGFVGNVHALQLRSKHAKNSPRCAVSGTAGKRGRSLHMGFFLSRDGADRKHTKNHGSNGANGSANSVSNSKDGRQRWVTRVWKKLAAPPAGMAHDEITFRSGCQGRPHSIPQAERYSSAAWWHNVKTLPTSVILHRIKQPLLAQTCWATAVSLLHFAFGGTWSMSVKPHTLLGSALGLLLVFRTNAAYQRFQEGRKLWEEVLTVSRDIARMSTLYRNVFGVRLVQRVGNLLACHAVILQEHLQGYKEERVWQDLVEEEEVSPLLNTTCNRPLMLVNMISQEIRDVPYKSDDWTSRERLAVLTLCNKLGATIGGCERLVQTPVPLHYVRHTSRFLTIWCFLLPLVIVGEMGMATAPVVCLATWALFGIQEIGLLIEDPFQSALSLEIMCNAVYSDVMQTIGAAVPTLPQQPIPMQHSISVSDSISSATAQSIMPLSSRCRHPAVADNYIETHVAGVRASY